MVPMNEASPLARYLVPLRRWWYVPTTLLVVALAVTWLTLPEPHREPTQEEIEDPSVTFRATHILVRETEPPVHFDYELILLLARHGEITNRVVDALDGDVDSGDVESVELEADPEIDTLTITAVQPGPDLAAELATTYALELSDALDERATRSIQEDLDQVNTRLAETEERIEDLEEQMTGLEEGSLDRRLLDAELDSLITQYGNLSTEAQRLSEQQSEAGAGFDTLQLPTPVPASADGPFGLPASPGLRLTLATLFALLAGFGLVMGLDYLDTRVHTRRDVEESFGLPVIAELPYRAQRDRDADPLPVVSDPGGPTAEAFRALRLSVQIAPVWRLSTASPSSNGSIGTKTPIEGSADPRLMLVTSPLTGDGKSTLVANLAASFAEAGQRVLVVDCDFRRPAVGRLLGVGPGSGLREMQQPDEQPLANFVLATSVPYVGLVRAGEPGVAPSWFLTNSSAIVEQAHGLADVVLFDTGPLTLTNEAAALVPHVDAVLLVSRAGRLSTDQAHGAIEQLARLSAPVAGVVMVGSDAKRRYGYDYYEPTTSTAGGRWSVRS